MKLIEQTSEWCNQNSDGAAKITADWMGISEEAAAKAMLHYTTEPSDSWKDGVSVYLTTLDKMDKYEGALKGKQLNEIESSLFDFQFVK
jgi:ABC-type nitrate/sulfonate/bicarbonate transport system substrate-binding protein